MPDIKWIHLDVNIHSDDQVKIMLAMPDGYEIFYCWIRLICLAGKLNASGYVYIKENIPYTDDLLAPVMGLSVQTIRLAMELFKKLGMIQIEDNGYILVVNFPKWNDLEAADKIRDQNRIRQIKHRAKQKQLLLGQGVTLPSRYVTQQEEDKDKEEEEDYNNNPPIVPPSLTASAGVLDIWVSEFRFCFGREPDSREMIMIRDFAQEIDGSLTDQQIKDAFKEASKNNVLKFNYVKKILRTWAGLEVTQ